MREDAEFEAFVEHERDGAECDMRGKAGDGFRSRRGAAKADAGFGEGGVVCVDVTGVEDFVDRFELEEQG